MPRISQIVFGQQVVAVAGGTKSGRTQDMQHAIHESASDGGLLDYWSWISLHRSPSHAQALYLAVGTRETRHVRFALGELFFLHVVCGIVHQQSSI